MEEGGSIVSLIVMIIVYLAAFAVLIAGYVGMWKVFDKAGKPGWAAIIPIYNMIVLCEIADKPMWYIVLGICIPVVFFILIGIGIAERFGKDQMFGIIWLGIAWPIGYARLGFSDATYSAPSGS